MADQEFQQPSFFSSLKRLGRSVSNLGRAFEGKSPLDDIGKSIDSVPVEKPKLPPVLPAPQADFEDARLLTQHTPGWHAPHPSHLPVPTYAPVMTAFGIVFVALGAVTVWPISVIGAVIFLVAIAKWIGELLHD